MSNVKQSAFEQLNVMGFRKLLQFAMRGLGQELHNRQTAIIMREKFGDKSVPYPEYFNPNRETSDLKGDIRDREYKDLMEFAVNVQNMLDHVAEIEMQEFAKGVGEFFRMEREEMNSKAKTKSSKTK